MYFFLHIFLQKNCWTLRFTLCFSGTTTGGSPVNHRPRHHSPLQHSLKPIIRERRPIASLPSSAITTSILIIHFSAEGAKKKEQRSSFTLQKNNRTGFFWPFIGMSKLVGAAELERTAARNEEWCNMLLWNLNISEHMYLLGMMKAPTGCFN